MTEIVEPPFRDPDLDVSGEVVGFYPREFYALDNFSSFQVIWQGRRWPTSEHAYQASHFFDTYPEIVDEIAESMSADQALRIAREHADKIPGDWDDRKVAVMEQICLAKLMQNPYVQKKLLQTGEIPIVEDSPKDDFWGWGADRQGRNELGKIWMRLREQLGSGDIEPVNYLAPVSSEYGLEGQWPEFRSFIRVYSKDPWRQSRLAMALLGFRGELAWRYHDDKSVKAINTVIAALAEHYPEFLEDGFEATDSDVSTSLGSIYRLDSRLENYVRNIQEQEE